MKHITGDLIRLAKDREFDIIVHGCNCFNTMGAGIAYQIAKHFPSAYRADQKTESGDPNKLGTVTYAFEMVPNGYVMIINAYTQFDIAKSADDVAVDYDAVRSVFRYIADWIHDTPTAKNLRIGYPMIGAGLANGDWNVISSIIDEELEGLDHTLVIYNGA